ncbi:YHS domain-containing (seleno)protein [Chryseolinea soli]|uniref:YHS domain-containing protein n=1 Tax=Chryseolinea soli TaxID=2321403 RepID=A0A385SM75_9BACT|nr:YHS domain-containing (seleno)protein [Chryseolinea soli]AYB31576.1 YHS domain-containing protein [Chryseolinea soli]
MKKLNSLLIVLTVLVISVSAQKTADRKAQFNLAKSGLAIQGYDPVAYFVNNKAVEGKPEIAAVYNGVTYQFASTKNKEAFNANPAKYEPQYGGWCAYAMGSKGEKVEIDPQTFKIVDGKLFLFYNKLLTNTLPMWNKDETHLKTNADQNWTKFVH